MYKDSEIEKRSDIDFMKYSSFYGKMYRKRSKSRGSRTLEEKPYQVSDVLKKHSEANKPILL